jgi:hypothetical protein
MSTGRREVVAALLLLAACGSHEAPPAPALEVWGHMGSGRQSIGVWQDGVEVADAWVEVDGQQLYSVCAGCGWYEGTPLPSPVTGDVLSLRVTHGPSVVTGSGALPEAPLLTSPAGGGTYVPSDAIPVEWTISRQPDRFEVHARWTCGNVSTTYAFHAGGWERALTIPANAFMLCFSPVTLVLSALAVNDGSLVGDYVPYTGGRGLPGMNIAAESNWATLRQ